MDGIPLRLDKDPIVEALVELRFRGAAGVPISDLLPGMLYPKVRDRFPTIDSLPVSQVPREFRLRDPNLLYKPCHKLDGGQFVIAIGERVFTFSCIRPYVGWENFEREILDLYALLEETGIISVIERFSIKYVNIIPAEIADPPLAALSMNVVLGGIDLQNCEFNLRATIEKEGFTNIIQIVSGATANIPGTKENLHGTILDIDTISPNTGGTDQFWVSFPDKLRDARRTEKNLFFAILTNDAVSKFDPVWEADDDSH